MRVFVLLAVLTCAGCSTQATSAVPAPAKVTPDVWARNRECSADAERYALQVIKDFREGGGGTVISGWENHYNRQTDRCYVSFAMTFTQWTKANAGMIPLFSVNVFDLFEHAIVASYTDESLNDNTRGVYCAIMDTATRNPEPAQSCALAKARAIAFMTQ